MDIAPSCDIAVRFGAQILQGEKPSPLQGNGKWAKANGGLLLGQRELVVVSVDGEHGHQNWPVRLVNHGDQQKEATRRLFDAHVYAQSFNRETLDNSEHVNELNAKVKKLEREIVVCSANRVPQGASVDLEKLANRVTQGASASPGEAGPKKPPAWLTADSDTREMINQFSSSIMIGGAGGLNKKDVTDQLWIMMEASVNKWGHGPDEELVKQAQAAEARARKVFADALKESSEARGHLKKTERKYRELANSYNALQKAAPPAVRAAAAAAAGGRPATAAAAVSGFDRSESEVNARPGQGHHSVLGASSREASNRPATSHGGFASHGSSGTSAAAANGGQASTRQSSGPAGSASHGNSGASAAVANGGQANSAAISASGSPAKNAGNSQAVGGAPAKHAGHGQAGSNQTSRGAGGATAAPNDACTSPSRHGGGGDANRSPSKRGSIAPLDVAESPGGGWPDPDEHPGYDFEVMGWDGEYVELNIGKKEMDTMDNELFEPLSVFDEDMTALLIDVVNEKVRRILLLNPEKFNGRLPYGIKGEVSEDDGLIQQLRDTNAELLGKLDQAEEELVRLRAMVEQLRKRMQRMEAAPGEVPPPIKEAPPPVKEVPSPTGRGRPVVVEAPPPVAVQECKWTDAKVQAAIDEAVEKATRPLKRQIAELEDALKKSKEEVDTLKKENAKLKLELEGCHKEIARLKKELEDAMKEIARYKKDLEDALAREKKLQSDLEAARKRISDLESQPGATTKIVEKIVEKVKIVEKIVEKEKIVYQGDENTIVALQSALKMLQKFALSVQLRINPGGSSKFADQVNKLLGEDCDDWQTLSQTTDRKSLGGDPKSGECYEAMPIFADWCEEVCEAVEQYQKPVVQQVVQQQQQQQQQQQVVQQVDPGVKIVEKVVEKMVTDPKDQAEIEKLKAKIREQQEEISRLLLMIEEMRHRLELVQDVMIAKGGEVAAELEKALKEVGLKELVEAKSGQRLKNVYERLYQDALQRMQRLALILEQKAEANKLYFASVAAAKQKGSSAHAAPPDLDKLTDAALVAIHGMWYHYDILFRRVCEQSQNQSIKDNSTDNYKLALADIFGSACNEFEDLGSLRVPQNSEEDNVICRSPAPAPAQAPRPFSERRICNSAGAVSPGGGIAFATQPQKVRRRPLGLPEKEGGDFKSYMAKMQESGQAPAQPSTQLHAQRRPKSDSAPTRPDSLGALTLGNGGAKRNGMNPSVSLPSLPRGLANLKAGPPAAWSFPSHLTSQSTADGGLGSGESSLVLQDSWMSSGLNCDGPEY